MGRATLDQTGSEDPVPHERTRLHATPDPSAVPTFQEHIGNVLKDTTSPSVNFPIRGIGAIM